MTYAPVMTVTDFQPGRTYAIVRKPIEHGAHLETRTYQDDDGNDIEYEAVIPTTIDPGGIVDVTDWPPNAVIANESQGRIEILPANPVALERLAETVRMAPDIVDHPSQDTEPPKEHNDDDDRTGEPAAAAPDPGPEPAARRGPARKRTQGSDRGRTEGE